MEVIHQSLDRAAKPVFLLGAGLMAFFVIAALAAVIAGHVSITNRIIFGLAFTMQLEGLFLYFAIKKLRKQRG